jgi:hypothetical protein
MKIIEIDSPEQPIGSLSSDPFIQTPLLSSQLKHTDLPSQEEDLLPPHKDPEGALSHRSSQLIPKKLLLIASNVPDLDALSEAASPDTLLYIYDFSLTTLESLRHCIKEIARCNHLSDIALVAHGEPGILHLTSTQELSAKALKHSPTLRSLFKFIAKRTQGHIDLIGCSLSSSQEGQDLIKALQALTQRPIGAPKENISSSHHYQANPWNLWPTKRDASAYYFSTERLKRWKGELTILVDLPSANPASSYFLYETPTHHRFLQKVVLPALPSTTSITVDAFFTAITSLIDSIDTISREVRYGRLNLTHPTGFYPFSATDNWIPPAGDTGYIIIKLGDSGHGDFAPTTLSKCSFNGTLGTFGGSSGGPYTSQSFTTSVDITPLVFIPNPLAHASFGYHKVPTFTLEYWKVSGGIPTLDHSGSITASLPTSGPHISLLSQMLSSWTTYSAVIAAATSATTRIDSLALSTAVSLYANISSAILNATSPANYYSFFADGIGFGNYSLKSGALRSDLIKLLNEIKSTLATANTSSIRQLPALIHNGFTRDYVRYSLPDSDKQLFLHSFDQPISTSDPLTKPTLGLLIPLALYIQKSLRSPPSLYDASGNLISDGASPQFKRLEELAIDLDLFLAALKGLAANYIHLSMLTPGAQRALSSLASSLLSNFSNTAPYDLYTYTVVPLSPYANLTGTPATFSAALEVLLQNGIDASGNSKMVNLILNHIEAMLNLIQRSNGALIKTGSDLMTMWNQSFMSLLVSLERSVGETSLAISKNAYPLRKLTDLLDIFNSYSDNIDIYGSQKAAVNYNLATSAVSYTRLGMAKSSDNSSETFHYALAALIDSIHTTSSFATFTNSPGILTLYLQSCRYVTYQPSAADAEKIIDLDNPGGNDITIINAIFNKHHYYYNTSGNMYTHIWEEIKAFNLLRSNEGIDINAIPLKEIQVPVGALSLSTLSQLPPAVVSNIRNLWNQSLQPSYSTTTSIKPSFFEKLLYHLKDVNESDVLSTNLNQKLKIVIDNLNQAISTLCPFNSNMADSVANANSPELVFPQTLSNSPEPVYTTDNPPAGWSTDHYFTNTFQSMTAPLDIYYRVHQMYRSIYPILEFWEDTTPQTSSRALIKDILAELYQVNEQDVRILNRSMGIYKQLLALNKSFWDQLKDAISRLTRNFR